MTKQKAIGSGFGFETTAAEAIAGIDLSGKTAFVTGGYSGIGTETVKALASADARVIVGARRPKAAREVLGDLATIVALSLDDPASIDACADAVAKETSKLDILINNAAIMANPLTRDARGFESQFATNHLGHFQLAARLWPLVAAAGTGARVVALSSLAHKRSAFHAEDPNYERRAYDKWEAYGQAKTSNALFAVHLDALAKAKGVRAFSVHPGGINTNLGRYLTQEDIDMFAKRRAAGLKFKSIEQGAATTVWAATSPQLDGMGGVYCENCDIAELTDDGIGNATGVMANACDPEAAAKLWEISETLTATRFEI